MDGAPAPPIPHVPQTYLFVFPAVSVFRELEESSPYNGLERLEREEGPSPRDSRLFIRVLKDRQTANDSSH